MRKLGSKYPKLRRDISVIDNRGKNATLYWKYDNEVLCSIDTESAKALAYDLLEWAKTKDKKWRRISNR